MAFLSMEQLGQRHSFSRYHDERAGPIVSSARKNVGLLRRLLEPVLVKSVAQLVPSIPEGPLRTTVRVVTAIRRIACTYVHEANVPSGYDIQAEYLGGLAAKAGRVALFLDYLERATRCGAS